MKTIKNLIYSLTAVILLSACSSDDNVSETDPTTQIPEVATTADLIATLTGGSERVWKVESASLSNSQVSDLNITNLANVQDDEFTFKQYTNSVDLRHNFGTAIDASGIDLNEVLSDTNRSSNNLNLEPSTNAVAVVSSSNDYVITTDDQDRILATLQISGGATLQLELKVKTAADYPSISNSLSTPVEIFSFEGYQPNYDIAYSLANESLYMAGRLSNTSQQLIKYDLNTNTDVTQVMTGSDYYTQQIAFRDDNIITLSRDEATESAPDLSGNPVVLPLTIYNDHFAVATIDNTFYAAGGFSGDSQDFLISASQDDASFSTSIQLPSSRTQTGIEIVDNEVYIFGGQDLSQENGILPTNDAFTLSLDSGSTASIALPTNTYRTYSARYENLIYIAGRTIATDTAQPSNYLGVFNTLTNELDEIDISTQLPNNIILRSFTANGKDLYFLVQDTNDEPVDNTFALKVLEAALN